MVTSIEINFTDEDQENFDWNATHMVFSLSYSASHKDEIIAGVQRILENYDRVRTIKTKNVEKHA